MQRDCASGSNLEAQFVHVEDPGQLVTQCLVHVDHEGVVDVVPGLDDLQLRFRLRQPVHHVDLEQQSESVATVVARDGGVSLTAELRL